MVPAEEIARVETMPHEPPAPLLNPADAPRGVLDSLNIAVVGVESVFALLLAPEA